MGPAMHNDCSAPLASDIDPIEAKLSTQLVYFITRENGKCVPMIPVDELPQSVRLRDVPRSIPSCYTKGMQYVGQAPFTGKLFALQEQFEHWRKLKSVLANESYGRLSPIPLDKDVEEVDTASCKANDHAIPTGDPCVSRQHRYTVA